MKEIIKYQADDGTIFPTKELCIKHEYICKILDVYMSKLPALPTDDDCSFANGQGYIQHNLDDVREVQNLIVKFAGDYAEHTAIDNVIKNGVTDSNIHTVTFVINNYTPTPFMGVWTRFMCIDKSGREWGQPYFALNPDKAIAKRLN